MIKTNIEPIINTNKNCYGIYYEWKSIYCLWNNFNCSFVIYLLFDIIDSKRNEKYRK